MTVPIETLYATLTSHTGTGPVSFSFTHSGDKDDLGVFVADAGSAPTLDNRLASNQFSLTNGAQTSAGNYTGGSVTLSTSVTSKDIWVIRDTRAQRPADLGTSATSGTELNPAFDDLVAMVQDIAAQVDRTPKVGPAEVGTWLGNMAANAGKVLGVNTDGSALAYVDLVTTTDSKAATFATLALLTAIAAADLSDNTAYATMGYNAAGDHGLASYRYEPLATDTAVAGMVIDPTNADGRLKRNYDYSVSVKWTGATGDGTTNDAAAIQAAMDWVSNTGGGTVYFPPGTYAVATQLTLRSNVLLQGAGRASVIKRTANVTLFDGACTGGGLDRLTIEGQRDTIGGGTQTFGPSIVSDYSLTNCYFNNCNEFLIYEGAKGWLVSGNTFYRSKALVLGVGGQTSTPNVNSEEHRIVLNRFLDCENEALDLNSNHSQVVIGLNTFRGFYVASGEFIDIGGGTLSSSIVITGNTFDWQGFVDSAGDAPTTDNGYYGVSLKENPATGAELTKQIVISSNVFMGGSTSKTTNACVLSTASTDVTVCDNMVETCYEFVQFRNKFSRISVDNNTVRSCISGVNFPSIITSVQTTTPIDLSVSNNIITSTSTTTFVINVVPKVEGLSVTNNNVRGGGRCIFVGDDDANQEMVAPNVSHNDCRGSAAYGIFLWYCDNLRCIGNVCQDNQQVGLVVSNCDGGVVEANQGVNNSLASAGTYDGIFVDTCTGLTLLGNRASGSSQRGIRFNACSGMIIDGNISTGNQTAANDWVSESGVTTSEWGVNIGLTRFNFGTAAGTTDGNGNVSIAHGLSSTPTFAAVHLLGDNSNGVDVESVDATNIVARVKNSSGADVSSVSVSIMWQARY